MLGKAGDGEVGPMNAEQQARALGDGALVVGQARAVGGADFAQRGLRFRHHVGNAEGASDLDEFAARDDDFATLGEGVKGEQDSGGVVVDDDGGERVALLRLDGAEPRSHTYDLGEQFLKKAVNVDVSLAAFAGLEIELKVGVGKSRLANVVEGSGGEWRASEIGVEDDAGRVDDGAQRVAERLAKLALDGGGEAG